MKKIIVIPDDYTHASAQLIDENDYPDFQIKTLGDLSQAENADAILAQAEALILIRERTIIDDAFLRRTPNLKLISQTGKVARNIDIEACTRAGVSIVEGSGSPIAPAELTWLLIMAAKRRLIQSVKGMQQGLWQTAIGQTVHGLKLGIIGYGKIGKRVAQFAKAFALDVEILGSERAQKEAQQDGFSIAKSRAEFFQSCDIVSVHLRLVKETEALIKFSDLIQMKKDALLVNISRAELLENGALFGALEQGFLGQVALDVYENEPVYDPHHPLIQHPKVLCTPHIGYAEQETYKFYFEQTMQNLEKYFAGDDSHVINHVKRV